MRILLLLIFLSSNTYGTRLLQEIEMQKLSPTPSPSSEKEQVIKKLQNIQSNLIDDLFSYREDVDEIKFELKKKLKTDVLNDKLPFNLSFYKKFKNNIFFGVK